MIASISLVDKYFDYYIIYLKILEYDADCEIYKYTNIFDYYKYTNIQIYFDYYIIVKIINILSTIIIFFVYKG